MEGAPPPTPAVPGARGSGWARWLTWRRALASGVAGFAVLVLAAGGFTAMHRLGIGPIGSLVAKGVLDERDRILIADFDSQTGHETLAAAVTEAFRVDFEQSTVVTPVPPAFVREALQRMGRADAAGLGLPVAREVARREGIKAVVAGEVNATGGSFVISVRLLAAADGAVLASFRQTARDSTRIIEVVDELSKQLRGRIGESLKSIRANEPLAQVTTPSLAALEKYSQAVRAAEIERDDERAVALLEEAIALDTAFAMAYRKLGVVLSNRDGRTERVVEALTRAYQHRDRLTDRERYLTLGTYYSTVEVDDDRAVTAYRTLLDLHPDDAAALNNLAGLYSGRRDYARAEELYRRAIAIDSTTALRYTNLAAQLVAQGKFAAADSIIRTYRRRFPDHAEGLQYAAHLLLAQGRYAEGAELGRELAEDRALPPLARAAGEAILAQVDLLHGRIAATNARLENMFRTEPRAFGGTGRLGIEIGAAFIDLLLFLRPDAARRRLADALARYPLDELPPRDRPYSNLVRFYAYAGDAERAAAFHEQHLAALSSDERERADIQFELDAQRAAIAHTRGRYDESLPEFRRLADTSPCAICLLPDLAQAYRIAGQPDSAIAAFERYIETPMLFRIGNDALMIPMAHRALAELYEEKGDAERAIHHYNRLAELWAGGDPEVQPFVDAARRAVERLTAERAPR